MEKDIKKSEKDFLDWVNSIEFIDKDGKVLPIDEVKDEVDEPEDE